MHLFEGLEKWLDRWKDNYIYLDNDRFIDIQICLLYFRNVSYRTLPNVKHKDGQRSTGFISPFYHQDGVILYRYQCGEEI